MRGGQTGGAPRATLFDIERFALHDGPGIRTVVFFKGCPLRCSWCSNPESQDLQPELFYRAAACLGCRRCVDACAREALSFAEGGLQIDRELCDRCGACVEGCNSTALSLVGRSYGLEEVLAEVLRDEPFYRHSGGGVTFSGGEPAFQPEALAEMARRCRGAGLNTALETCGHYPWEALETALPWLDLVLYDLKQIDSARHETITGVRNEQILGNFERLVAEQRKGLRGSGAGYQGAVRVRAPLVPGLNDREEDLVLLRGYLARTAPELPVDLLPYHRLGNGKYGGLGRPYALAELVPPDNVHVERARALLEEKGLSVRIEQ
ncbi:MAG: glycyl-radical enzyme activating protein [Spirochaetales bacterium]|nr:glycyl-radical enzyme activating protein [Spirochaetales bacterium]